ncbi:MAG: serine/threonine protein kinase [Verrucomicrobiia bacterium]|jgi:serine/threonine-protein kinase
MALGIKLFSNDDPTEKPGKFGRFYLHDLINSGGMASLWVATDQTGKTFTLRRLHSKLRFNLRARSQFLKGCKILASLPPHEGIVKYIEHGRAEGTLYLLMEYVECSNLKLLLARNDPLFTENVAAILIDMAVALEHLHDHGYMHLDFKPENVILTRSGNVKIVDFDLAQPISDKPKKLKSYAGTPAYMAPELLLRREVDQRADIFAFGVTAYELLTYQKPFAGETAAEVLESQYNRENSFVMPRQLNPDIPAPLEKVILKCLEYDPDKRYPIMSSLVHELQNILYIE